MALKGFRSRAKESESGCERLARSGSGYGLARLEPTNPREAPHSTAPHSSDASGMTSFNARNSGFRTHLLNEWSP